MLPLCLTYRQAHDERERALQRVAMSTLGSGALSAPSEASGITRNCSCGCKTATGTITHSFEQNSLAEHTSTNSGV